MQYKTDTKWLRGLVAFLVLANCTLTATNTRQFLASLALHSTNSPHIQDVIYYGFVQNCTLHLESLRRRA